MTWHEGRLCGFDLETSGVDVENDRIVTACVVQCGGGSPAQSASWLSDVGGMEIPEGAAKVHGITTERARAEGRPAAEVVTELIAALTQVVLSGVPVVVMNASYDLTLLDREARRHGVTPLVDAVGTDLRVIDPRVLDKHVSRRRGSRTLTALCQHYGVRLDGAHSADADAVAACRVAWRIGATRPELAALPLEQLHAQQIAWAREQGESLRDHFARTPGKESWADGVRTEWPLIPHQRGEA
ncbi:3'-5' exonuclease [Streptomyces sp. ISL-98]|uniref:exonuclease domain-containing protein n=1 Tax=Streptomyces sp. ISL-98 TaxID=2819192 RepID=UPI001BED2E48|nr:exonuclease domain-containing protein [Streptomyces sp. ISL-98]MBT2508863.1 3'-5' exonuclease [Streptomyces sp. ISL-98]